MSKYVIYALCDPDTNKVRYIGKSTIGASLRFNKHLAPSSLESKTHKNNWIKSLLEVGKVPNVEVLEIIPEDVFTHDILNQAEDFYIHLFKSNGYNLTNSQDGGKGSPNRKMSQYTRSLIGDKQKKYIEGKKRLGVKIIRNEKFKTKSNHEIVDGIPHKKCSDCLQFLHLNKYSKSKNTWDNLQNKCKQCDHKLYQKNREVRRLKTLVDDMRSYLKDTMPIVIEDQEFEFFHHKSHTVIDLCFSDTNIHKRRELCVKKNFNHIVIWAHEWRDRKQQCLNFITPKLGNCAVIAARKCDIKEVDKKTASEFINKNHIQPLSNFKICFGLYYDSRLVGLASFGAHHRGINEIVLSRLCFESGTVVVGGLSRLSKRASEYFKEDVYTWVHNTLSDGKSYLKCGWEYHSNLSKDYFYYEGTKVITKHSMKGSPGDKPESIRAAERKLKKVYDLGKLKLVYKSTEPKIISKMCTKCEVVKPLDMFNKDTRARDGRTSSCGFCEAERKKEYKLRRKNSKNNTVDNPH